MCIGLFVFVSALKAQSVVGRWKTIDDETGKEKSIVEIYEKNGLVYGKLVELLEKKIKMLFVQLVLEVTKINLI